MEIISFVKNKKQTFFLTPFFFLSISRYIIFTFIMWMSEEVCAITLQELNKIPIEERYTLIPCKHTFHKTSIFQHFQTHNTCPCCRKLCTERDNRWERTIMEQTQIENEIFKEQRKTTSNIDVIYEVQKLKTNVETHSSVLINIEAMMKESVQNFFFITVGLITLMVSMLLYNYGPWTTVCASTISFVFSFAYSPNLWQMVQKTSNYSIELNNKKIL